MINDHPWIHLEYPDPESLLQHCAQNDIQSNDDVATIHHINYLFNSSCFNMLPGSAYLESAASLTNARIKINNLQLIADQSLVERADKLIKLGHERSDLVAQTHTLIAHRIR
jgi:hypothetical protein